MWHREERSGRRERHTGSGLNYVRHNFWTTVFTSGRDTAYSDTTFTRLKSQHSSEKRLFLFPQLSCVGATWVQIINFFTKSEKQKHGSWFSLLTVLSCFPADVGNHPNIFSWKYERFHPAVSSSPVTTNRMFCVIFREASSGHEAQWIKT